ncbi:PucR family transcriptional regulator [Planococcus shenhongbingii]|uniref:PucR family transcriptional regulator n=1 Tax=Planococcus shenhongbingii TaxID=3058398 RepID=UPI00261CE066|nr:PucR family transcriptional regulator [Planococcus sp. N016]WKA59389.1 PucR family transcriptional regulator [Planococcus sp. N016]
MEKLKLTIKEVLERKSFANARLIAGKEGLDRQVKWSHILEVKELDTLINGGELIFTTGVGLQLDLQTQLKYVKRLIDEEVAGICIEMGPYFKEIPQELIELADRCAFPVIIFDKTTRFVDITQDLHTFIINQHHQMLSQLDALSRKFNSLSLTHNGILKILQELHQFFQQRAIFITDNEKPYFFPSDSKVWEKEIRTQLEQSPDEYIEQRLLTFEGITFAVMPVEGLGQVLGHLCLQLDQSRPEEFSFLILDRASLAIAQILLRHRTIEERKQNNEDEFVRNLVNGRTVELDDFQAFLPPPSRNTYYRVFTISTKSTDAEFQQSDWEEIKLQRLMSVRALFKRAGFFPALSCSKSEIVAIASFISAEHLKNEANRSLQVIRQITDMKGLHFIDGKNCACGVSSVYQDVEKAKKAYEEAGKAARMMHSGIVESPLYENLGIYKLLLEFEDSGFLKSYAESYLAPVFEYDQKMDSNLFATLAAYLESNGSKKETADRLFVVRQTLYLRLEKLETLLGKDFMAPAKRLALESAVMAIRLLDAK